MAHRYFLTDLYKGTATVCGEDAIHLTRVMRIKVGDNVTLCDKEGYDYSATLRKISEDELLFDVGEPQKNPAEPTKELVVYMALPKSDKLEFVVQKSCELGAVKLVPFVSEYCIAQKSKKEDNKLQRLQKIANEACKQCGRSTPMTVCPTLSFKEMMQDLKHQDLNLFFYEHATIALKAVDFTSAQSVGLIIGSEGGFSQKECDALQKMDIPSVSLGSRILRCETAAVVATSLTMFLLNELD